MPAPVVKANSIVALILTWLAKIGTGPTQWNTNPPDAIEGAPGDALPDLPHQLYLVHLNTVTREGDGLSVPVSEHNRRMHFAVWMFAKDTDGCMDELRKLEDDVLRTLHASDTEMQTLTGFPVGSITFSNRDDMRRAGFCAAGLEFYCDYVWVFTPL